MDKDKASQLEERIHYIEAELTEVKKELRTISKSNKSDTAFEEKPVFSAKKTAKQKSVKKKQPIHLEQLIGDWLPRVFIFVLILGIIWAFIAAIDKGWISPWMRVLSGFAVSGILYWLGNRQYQKMQNALSVVLLGGSIVVYIAALFAGNVLYDIIPYYITLVLLAAGIAAGVWMSRKYASETLLAIIGIGAYLYPFLFEGDRGSENLFYLYETLIFAGLILESIKKHYKTAWSIANYAFIFAVIFFAVTGAGQFSLVTFLTLSVQQLLIICLTFRIQHATSKEMYIPAIAAGAFFLFLIGEDVFGPADSRLYIFYAITAVAYGVLSMVKSKSHHELRNVFFVFSMFYVFMFVTQLFSEAEYIRLVTYTIQAMVVYYVSQHRNSLFGTIASLIVLMPVVGELVELPGFQLTFTSLICWLLVIGFFLATYIYRGKSVVLGTSLIKKGFPYLIALLVLVFFSKISEWIAYPDSSLYNIGLSMSWMIFVAVMYGAYSIFKDKRWQYIGLAFLFITLGKMILFDLTTVDIVWRAFLFIVLGVIGLLISRIFYNRKEK